LKKIGFLECVSVFKGGAGMRISDYLREDMICLNLKATGKEEAIRELGSFIRKAKEISNYEMFHKDVLEREKLASTGIGEEVAIPHARTDAVSGFVVAFGKSESGVEFESLDRKKARLIFLMGTPKTAGLDEYLVLLAHLTRLLKEESFRESLIKAQSPVEIIDIFKKFEK
jgi:fructose-specific phosphotransferase system IIA component